ncbi:MAG TPA: alpha/beta hydrolase [Actinomycetes bacterium]|jgi:alpha-beta hydrolase superfamily lysophospholipase|nr:alpha/beta hydrolase [Actinomycetes bacterium]
MRAGAGGHEDHVLRARDSVPLLAQTWSPDRAPTGVVCLVHGLGDHSGRYRHLCSALVGAGYAVAAFDLRGHGRSDGRRGHTLIDETMNDIDLVLDDTRRRFGSIPCFLYGHSLGGLLVLAYALRRRPALAGVVASGPALHTALREQKAKVLAVRALGRLLPRVTLPSGLEDSLLSRDPEVVAAYRADPLVHSRASLGFAMGALATIDWTLAHADRFPLPLLILHGGADRLNYPSGSRAFADRAGGDCTLKIYQGLYHEIHNEPERQRMLDDLVHWLDDHVPPSGAREGSAVNDEGTSATG